jgi:large subunit ribosomal protein L2
MTIKFYKPYTPTLRHKRILDFSNLKKKKNKQLQKSYQKANGRNNKGHITVRHKGGGHKQLYRIIDFKRNKYETFGTVVNIEYDPNRNANIALINYSDGTKRYILHPENLHIGNKIISSLQFPINLNTGNCFFLKHIPLGTEIHNIEFFPKKGGQLIRAAGTCAKILAKEKNFVIIRLCSKEIRLFNKNCLATIGKIGNSDYYNVISGKAGRKRWFGIRPTTRGTAMNPIDHPHGGGEGKCPIGRPRPLTPWGKPALGKKTRKNKKNSDRFIISV